MRDTISQDQGTSLLQNFLETAAQLLSKHDSEKILPTHKGLPPTRECRRKILNQLLEFYGFEGEFEAAWRVCEQSGLDTVTSNYLIFGLRSSERKYGAHQAFYFSWGSPPLTDIGMTQTAEIFPLVDEELERFEVREGKNLFDYYLDISSTVIAPCLEVPDLQHFSQPKGNDTFKRGEFQRNIYEDFRSRFLKALQPFEERLQAVFDNPAEFVETKEMCVEQYRTGLRYALRQKHRFLDGHFCAVSGRSLPGMCYAGDDTYRDGKHQIEVPSVILLVGICMGRNIAKIFRECENRYRRNLGLKGVGQGWVSEATLLATLQKSFPDETVLHHARPPLDRRTAHRHLFSASKPGSGISRDST